MVTRRAFLAGSAVSLITIPFLERAARGHELAVGSAIQDAIDDAYENGFGGDKIWLPPGDFHQPNGLVVKGGVQLIGSGRTTTLLNVGAAHVPVIRFDTSCNYAGASDLSCYGDTTSEANCVEIGQNVPVNLTNMNIFGGYNALRTSGVDGLVHNVFTYSSANTNVLSDGSNNYIRLKCDVAGAQAPLYGFYQAPSFGGLVIAEQIVVDSDFTGDFGIAAMAINDGGAHKSKVAFSASIMGGHLIVESGGVFQASGSAFGPDLYFNDALCEAHFAACNSFQATCLVHGGSNIKIGPSCTRMVLVP